MPIRGSAIQHPDFSFMSPPILTQPLGQWLSTPPNNFARIAFLFPWTLGVECFPAVLLFIRPFVIFYPSMPHPQKPNSYRDNSSRFFQAAKTRKTHCKQRRKPLPAPPPEKTRRATCGKWQVRGDPNGLNQWATLYGLALGAADKIKLVLFSHPPPSAL